MTEPEIKVVKLDPDALAQSAFGMTKAEAHEKGICLNCKRRPVFHSDAGRREYQISGVCEPCFDEMFGEEPE